MSKKLGLLLDKLNSGENFGEYKNVQISYSQLRDMFVYYRPYLDKNFAKKKDKSSLSNATSRIFYDLNIVVNFLSEYMERRGVKYNEVNHNVVKTKETKTIDNSKYLLIGNKTKTNKNREKIDEDINDFVDEYLDLDD